MRVERVERMFLASTLHLSRYFSQNRSKNVKRWRGCQKINPLEPPFPAIQRQRDDPPLFFLSGFVDATHEQCAPCCCNTELLGFILIMELSRSSCLNRLVPDMGLR